MHVIVTDALPPTPLAASLADELESRYPALVQFFSSKGYQMRQWSLLDHACTPKEAMRLQELGFVSDSEQPIGRALATHLASEQPERPVWIAEMCSIFVGQDRTTLLPLDAIKLNAAESESLSASAASLLDTPPSGLRIEPIHHGRWRVYGDLPQDTLLPSPAAVSYEDLGDWWPTSDAWRPWRKLVNELQMLWHTHPVNENRMRQGLMTVNGLWLYGGGGVPITGKQETAHWIEDLSDAAGAADWHAWLDQWQSVAKALMAFAPDAKVTLTAPDRVVHLNQSPSTWWRALFRVSQDQQWRLWWQNSK